MTFTQQALVLLVSLAIVSQSIAVQQENCINANDDGHACAGDGADHHFISLSAAAKRLGDDHEIQLQISEIITLVEMY